MGGGYEIERLSVENIERIEVIRGPLSALYGSEALGGVINIVTRQPEKLGVQVNTELSSYLEGGLQKGASLSISSPPLGNLSAIGSVSYVDRDPYEGADGQLIYQGRFINASLKTVYHLASGAGLTLDTAFMNELVDPEARSAMSGAMQRTTWADSRYDASLELQTAGEIAEFRIRGYFSYYDKLYEVYNMDTDAVTNYITADRFFPALETRVAMGFRAAGDHLLTSGLEYRADTYRGTKIKTGEDFEFEIEVDGKTYGGATKTIHYAGIYLQDEWSPFNRLLVIGSLRYDGAVRQDDAVEFTGALSPKIGLTFSPLPGLRAKAVYGRGFRTPDVEELFYDFTAYMGPVIGVHHVIGNPDLQPETSHSVELSLEGEAERLSGKVAYFYNGVDNLIEAIRIGGSGTVPDPTVSQYQNIQKARFQGVELETGLQILEPLTLSASYAFLEALNLTEDERLWERPRHKILAKLGYDSEPLGLHANVYLTYNGGSIENGEDKSWTQLDASVSKDIGPWLTIFAGGNNLLNVKDTDIPLVGMNLYGGVRLEY
jgi:outer membrane receptor for ferrienterochelin and colicins